VDYPPAIMDRRHIEVMIAHCLNGLPDEACGLLVGPLDPANYHPTGEVVEVVPCRNIDKSARTYSVHPQDHVRVMNAAQDAGMDIIGVFHSHTHSDAYPSPTDVRQAPDPSWLYVLVSLKDPEPTVRTYRIVDGDILEADMEVSG